MSEVLPLTHDELRQVLAELPGWQGNQNGLTRSYKFPTFAAAIEFMRDCVADIDTQDHHPEWTNVYNRVLVKLATHDAGNRVTIKDVRLAELLERTARRRGAAEPTGFFRRPT
jgi:4a-hydroxytetrahydrobiopterin dehydratase